MPTPWDAPIRKAGQLSIFQGKGAKAASWAKIMKAAVAEFNRCSSTYKLGVTFVESTTAPSETGPGGADVNFDTANGSTGFKALGVSFKIQVDANGLIGDTELIKSVFGKVTTVSKAFIFLPATPKAGGPKGREVGEPVKLVMAVHELIHACGLDNNDHSNDDVFFGFPSLTAMTDPSKDYLTVGQTKLPPIIMTANTVKKIQSVW